MKNNTTRGTLYIISAASGTGKTSLSKALADTINNIKISISHTTRPIRIGEIADQSYFFIGNSEFDKLAKQNLFLEHAKVFNYQYGTSRAWVESQLNSGTDIILDIDWQGAQQIRAHFDCTSIFLLPPSYKELQSRLENRQRESAEIIKNRMAAASSEISHCTEFDYIIINDKFEAALFDLSTIILSKRLRNEHQIKKYDMLIKKLVNN